MLSRRHRWPVWLIVLLATGWLSTEPVNADKAVDGQPPAAADLGPQLDTLPAEKASEADKPGYPDQAPLSPSRPQNKNTGSSPILTLSTGQWVSGTIQQWLERYSGRAFSPLAPVPETPAPHAMLSTLSATAPDIVAGPAEPLEPPPTHDLKVMLDWYPSPRHAPLFIAQQRGLFQQRGLEVELVTPADPEAPTKLLAAGRVDLALTRQPLLHLLVNEGKPLTRVASLIRLPLSFLLVGRPDFDDLGCLTVPGSATSIATADRFCFRRCWTAWDCAPSRSKAPRFISESTMPFVKVASMPSSVPCSIRSLKPWPATA